MNKDSQEYKQFKVTIDLKEKGYWENIKARDVEEAIRAAINSFGLFSNREGILNITVTSDE